MKWQHYGPDVQDEMCFDLKAAPLEKLYQLQADVEARLAELRASEPSPKRENTEKHIIWFSFCQNEIKRLHDIRDAIQNHLTPDERDAGSQTSPDAAVRE